jgi:thiol-disulfide isomerase/thioredoxin
MRPPLLLLLAVAACGRPPETTNATGPDQSASAGPQEAPPSGRLDRTHAGSAAPTTAFEDPDGEAATLADFRGRALLVNLWATWCAPCVAEMPTLDALAAREGEALQVLAVSQDRDGRAKVESFFAERRFSMLQPFLDPQMGLMEELGVTTLPATILYDAGGREVWRVIGPKDWQSEEAAKLIAEASPAKAR